MVVGFEAMERIVQEDFMFSYWDQDYLAAVMFMVFEIILTRENLMSNENCNRFFVMFSFALMYFQWIKNSQKAFYNYQSKVHVLLELLLTNDVVED